MPAPAKADLEQPPRRPWLRALAVLLLIVVLGAGFIGLWTWRLAVQDLPEIPSAAELWSLNRPADVVFVDKDGVWLGERAGHKGDRIALDELPPYVASAFLSGTPHIARRLGRDLFPSVTGELQEKALAWRLEQRLSPPEMLALHLDRAPFGAGAYGLDAAADTYFGKPAGMITLPEAAFLAALVDGPMHDSTDAAMRTEAVLARMRDAGKITQSAFDAARAQPLKLAEVRTEEPEFAAVLDFAAEEARSRAPRGSGALLANLTLDAPLQREAIRALRKAGAADAVVAAISGGEVSAIAASLDHRFEPVGRLMKQRPLGEVALPIVQAAALEAKLPRNEIIGEPLDKLSAKVGTEKVNALAVRLGLVTPPDAMGPAASPLDLAAALQVFRDGGRRIRPTLIARITDSRGLILYARPENAGAEVYAPALSGQMTAMMHSSIQSTGLDRLAAGAGGAAGDGGGGWFAGFTTDLSAAVWSRNGAGDGAKTLWLDFMQAAAESRVAKPLQTTADAGSPRAQFYSRLAEDFDRLGREAAPQ